MTREMLYHVLYLFLYTVFWCALTAIAYNAFFLDGAVQLQPRPYAFIAGLFFFVCGGVRSLRGANGKRKRKQERDPILDSFAASGILLILFANFS